MHTHARILSMHNFRSLYCIIKNNNEGHENMAMIQQQRSEALRAEKTFPANLVFGGMFKSHSMKH